MGSGYGPPPKIFSLIAMPAMTSSIVAVEANLVQGTTGAGLRGAFAKRLELDGRQGDHPVTNWFLVHGNIRRRMVNDQERSYRAASQSSMAKVVSSSRVPS